MSREGTLLGGMTRKTVRPSAGRVGAGMGMRRVCDHTDVFLCVATLSDPGRPSRLTTLHAGQGGRGAERMSGESEVRVF